MSDAIRVNTVNRNNVAGIMDRIEVATCKSPIAVFQHVTITKEGLHEPDFEVLFASTVVTQARIKYNSAGLVGVFYNDGEKSIEKIKSFFTNYESDPVWEGV